jgi:3-hydroxyacyl-[acyl-carrier-protein] dehydratase
MNVELCDPRQWAEAPVLIDLATVHERIPQRHEMALLHGVLHHDTELRLAIGVHEARETDFWVRGHIPRRPLMPGVVMIEIAAQLCAWLGSFSLDMDDGQIFGFAGVDRARFRGSVVPGDRMIMASQLNRMRRNIGTFQTQAWVNGDKVFEGLITGVKF